MKSARVFVVLALAALLVLSGCKRKKQVSVPPPQEQAPTVQQPAPQPAVVTPPPQPGIRPQPEKPAPQKQATTTPPKPKPKKKVAKKPAEPPATASAKPAPQPRKVIIQSGGTSDTGGQMTARAPNEAVSHEQQTTEQLLAGTEANLRSLTRQLTSDEQDTVQQIRSYMQQSRDASSDGDLVRARNLALKAHLLSDELVTR